MAQQDNIIAAVPRKVYSNAHAYHIHSISVNSDQETYISADDLRINLWNLNISDQSFSECGRVLCCIFTDSVDRHRRHQTREHGRANRSHNSDRVPSDTLQFVHVLELKKQYQARGYARFRAVRSAIKVCVAWRHILLILLFLIGYRQQVSKKRKTQRRDPSFLRLFPLSLTSNSATMGDIFFHETTCRSKYGTSIWSRDP
jgi:hypothetical protein